MEINYRKLALLLFAIGLFLTIALVWSIIVYLLSIPIEVSIPVGFVISFIGFFCVNDLCQYIYESHFDWFKRGWKS